MNKTRSKKILSLAEDIAVLREKIESFLEEEQEYYDELSEKMQESEKGIFSYHCISSIENALSELESASDNLEYCEMPDY